MTQAQAKSTLGGGCESHHSYKPASFRLLAGGVGIAHVALVGTQAWAPFPDVPDNGSDAPAEGAVDSLIYGCHRY